MNLKVAEKMKEEKVNDDKGGEYKIHKPHKFESPSKSQVS
jgi:hypothetical protein